MFILCREEESDMYHEELIKIEQDLFSSLGLHFKYGFSLTFTHFSCFVLLFVTVFAFSAELWIWLQGTWVLLLIVNLMWRHGCQV